MKVNSRKHTPDITLIGYSPRTYPVLVDLAAMVKECSPCDLKIQVVYNLNISIEPPDCPSSWATPEFLDIGEWNPEYSSLIMPGVVREPSVSKVWESFSNKKGLKRDQLGTVIHSSAAISQSSQIGPGTWVHPNAVVGAMSKIGFCCRLNHNTALAHHNELGDFSRINPGSVTSGYCQIGARVTIGTGACLRENISIGDDCFIGAGAVVVKDGPVGHLGIGNPAQWTKRTDL